MFLRKIFFVFFITAFLCGCNSSSSGSSNGPGIIDVPVDKILSNHCFGGKGYDSACSMAISSSGIIWIIGETSSESGNGDVPISKRTGIDIWLFAVDLKKSEGEQIIYNRCFGGDGLDSGKSVALSSDGKVWVVGNTESTPGSGDIPAKRYVESDIWVLGIDPNKSEAEQITYNRCFGGDSYDFASSIAVSSAGVVWVVGFTESEVGSGDIPSSKHARSDVWLLGIDPKKSETEQIYYNRCFGGYTNSDDAWALLLSDDVVWIAGGAYSASGSGDIPSKHGNNDIWILGINPKNSEDKQIVYNRCFGGSGHDYGSSIALSPTGIIWVAGYAKSAPGSGDIPLSKHGVLNDVWVLGINPQKSESEQIVYNRCFGGDEHDYANSITVSSNGIVWVAGYTESTPGSGDVPTNKHGNIDAWVLGINPTKTEDKQIVYNHCLGGDKDDRAMLAVASNSGQVWAIGETYSEPGNGDVPIGKHGSCDAWLFRVK